MKKSSSNAKENGVSSSSIFAVCTQIPAVFRGQHAGAEHVEEAVHLRLHARVKLPDRMMQAGGELDRHAVRDGRDERARDLDRRRKRRGDDAAGAQFEAESIVAAPIG